MAGLNRVILIGNLTVDPELRYTQNGVARTRFQLAVNRRWRDRDGNMQEEATFVSVVVWGAQAESCVNFLTKGRQVAVDGRLRIYTFQTEEGEQRKVTEVVAERVVFLGARKEVTETLTDLESPPVEKMVQSEEQPPEGEEEVPF